MKGCGFNLIWRYCHHQSIYHLQVGLRKPWEITKSLEVGKPFLMALLFLPLSRWIMRDSFMLQLQFSFRRPDVLCIVLQGVTSELCHITKLIADELESWGCFLLSLFLSLWLDLPFHFLDDFSGDKSDAEPTTFFLLTYLDMVVKPCPPTSSKGMGLWSLQKRVFLSGLSKLC